MRRAAIGLFVVLAAAVTQAEAQSSGGERRYLNGRMLVKLKAECRDRVERERVQEAARFGIPGLDEECSRLGVDSIWPLYVNPRPSALAKELGCDLWYAMRFRAGVDAGQAAERVGALLEVAAAEPEYLLHLAEVPDDSLFSLQWNLAKIGAPAAWDYGHGDTSVVIGLADNGLEWHHPDIQANLYINPAEDLNHNGRFDTLAWPAGDIDGVDQDSNGLVDDVAGYNFIENSPDPSPDSTSLIHSHGTHVGGIANAVVNNRSGVAGAAWNCRTLACRCGTGALILPSAVVTATYYLTDQGADIISQSFGSTDPSQAIEDACNYARASGRLVVAGAGNNGLPDPFYPAAYPSVIAVAGSDQNDYRPYWSNYGAWVDVTAPGALILSTIAGHSYGVISGTSMSTPLVSGVLGWIWSQFPGWTNAQVESTLFASCVPMPETLYAQGMMGHGRISMSQVVLPLLYSGLGVSDWRVNDAAGNGNGRLDPGETAALIVTYHNSAGWRNAGQVRASLECSAGGVTLLRDSASFPDIPAGGSGDCSLDSFVIAVGESVPPQNLRLALRVTAEPDPVSPDTVLVAQCGSPRVLVVDDDRGAGYESYYTAACDSVGVLHALWESATQGSVPAETLVEYPVVVWFCGDDSTTTLAPEERSALVTYFRDGGRLLLSGQGIARDLDNRQSPFLADYLHAEFVADSTGQQFLQGLDGDPITGGEFVVAGGSGGANNGWSLDGVRPITGAQTCARYLSYPDTTVAGIMRYQGTYQLVFMSVPFEAVDHSTSRYLQRWTLLARVLSWFGERLPGVEDAQPAAEAGPSRLMVAPTVARSLSDVRVTAPLNGPAEVAVVSADGRVLLRFTADVLAGRQLGLTAEGPGSGVYFVTVSGPGWRLTQRVTVIPR